MRLSEAFSQPSCNLGKEPCLKGTHCTLIGKSPLGICHTELVCCHCPSSGASGDRRLFLIHHWLPWACVAGASWLWADGLRKLNDKVRRSRPDHENNKRRLQLHEEMNSVNNGLWNIFTLKATSFQVSNRMVTCQCSWLFFDNAVDL